MLSGRGQQLFMKNNELRFEFPEAEEPFGHPFREDLGVLGL